MKKKPMKKRAPKIKSKYKKPLVNAIYTGKDDWREAYQYWSSEELEPGEMDRLANAIVKYVEDHRKDPEFLTLEKLLVDLRVNEGSFHVWRKKNKSLDKAREFCLQYLGDKRERLSMDGKLSYTTFRMKQYQYDKKWKDAEEYHAGLKAKATAEAVNSIGDFQIAMKHVLQDLQTEEKS